ncbi:FecR family protein [uncultured Bacteroides sp.]|uniref:FecR family protein n=1 Tax=uncultured Bacteroides sp. TaxID=162156 RepID=UPI0026001CF1|nr:FecR domain-containing protein [uncultured Bacteroides sp.]
MDNKHNIYRIIRGLIFYFKAQEIEPSTNEIDRMWDSVSKKIEQTDKSIRRRYLFRIAVSVSAAAVLLLVFGLAIANKYKGEKDILDMASNLPKIENTENEIQLIMSSQKKISLQKADNVIYSSDGSILIDKKKVSDNNNDEAEQENQYNQLIVPKGKHTQLQLADGSVLHINSGSRVVYPRAFSGKRREIFVDGEIYIDVQRNESAPFIVKTTRFEVEVLGTAFNVNAYSENSVSEIALLRGAVRIKDSSRKTLLLAPDELGTVCEGAIQGKHAVVASDYIAWTRGLLVLNAEPLGTVLQKLERYFDTHISFHPSVKELPMYGNLDLNHPLAEILRRISVTAPICYKETETGFYIEKRE